VDFLSLLGWVAHESMRVDPVLVPTAVALSVDVARLDEVGEDPLRGSFGDPDVLSDVAEPDVRSSGDAEEDLGVVRKEPPGVRVVSVA
jgi:hypothetical protein